jgi:hypothetical protein
MDEPRPETLLIAHVTVNLLDGSSFELYPFVDADDVKSKVSELVAGWAGSGFLLRGSHIIPWNQVKQLEATSVEEITRQDAQQRLLQWQAEDQRKAVLNFWKTKKEKKKDDKEGGDGDDKSDGDKDVKGGEGG